MQIERRNLNGRQRGCWYVPVSPGETFGVKYSKYGEIYAVAGFQQKCSLSIVSCPPLE